MVGRSGKTMLPPALLLLVYGVHVAYQLHDTGRWMVDDAFISFRYAENLVDGLGLVFNAGERVEGYTNLLWVLLLALCHGLGLSTPLAAQTLGVLAGGGAVLVLHRLASALRRDQLSGGVVALFAPAMLACSHNFVLWSLSGMETTLFTLLIVAGYLPVLSGQPTSRRAATAGALLALASLTRPDGALLAVCAAGCWLARHRRLDRRLALVLGLPLACVAAHLAFRLGYYGHPFPNTFYAKVGLGLSQLERGLEYLQSYAATYTWYLPLVLLAPVGRRHRAALGAALAVVLIYAGYLVYAGGDGLIGYRLVLPVVPLILLLLQAGLDRLLGWGQATGQRHLAAAVILLAMLGCLANAGYQTFGGQVHQLVQEDRVVKCGEPIGRYFKHHGKPGQVLAVNTAGSIPYHARALVAIDMLGLTDEHIAHKQMPDFGHGAVGHEKFDGAYVISRRPDYLVFGFSCNTLGEFPGDRQVKAQPGFGRYVRRLVQHEGYHFTYWQRQ